MMKMKMAFDEDKLIFIVMTALTTAVITGKFSLMRWKCKRW